MKINRAAVLMAGLMLAGVTAYAGEMEAGKSDSGIPFAEAVAKNSGSGGTVQGRCGLKALPKGMAAAASPRATAVVPPPPEEATKAYQDGTRRGLVAGGLAFGGMGIVIGSGVVAQLAAVSVPWLGVAVGGAMVLAGALLEPHESWPAAKPTKSAAGPKQ